MALGYLEPWVSDESGRAGRALSTWPWEKVSRQQERRVGREVLGVQLHLQNPFSPCVSAVCWPRGCCTGWDCRLGQETWWLWTS